MALRWEDLIELEGIMHASNGNYLVQF